ncbi:GNAT family N-acetyltransferase [Brasilonema sp. UFV-L1]|uniref:GNAT family N-acetyltransferase n=1 Tax=Brasilonema sp. UFV-L1 TaxID=2234130 RepID=UPI00145D2A3F|nr:GNAT family N-acetyltransferase [Brasilonema sp. UFV-L1]NMG09366.1 GNAT family N-acetyltransferase [Brasilonema sp. UFV-L1]
MLEELNLQNIDAALMLFKKYQEFYEVQNIDEEKNRKHLQMIMDNEELGKLFLAQDNYTYVGFATIYYSFSSRIAEKIAILNDLYVLDSNRGKGFGRQLLEHCFIYLKTRGINTVRWTTRQDNVTAQKLYNYYANGTEWLMYSYKI